VNVLDSDHTRPRFQVCDLVIKVALRKSPPSCAPRAAITTTVFPPSKPSNPRSSNVKRMSLCETVSIRCFNLYGIPKFHIGTLNRIRSARRKRLARFLILLQALSCSGVSCFPSSPAYFAARASPSKSGSCASQTFRVSTTPLGYFLSHAPINALAT
jgi:hypothetical protein